MSIRKDYLYHFVAGFTIAMMFYVSTFPYLALIMSTIAGIVKEIYDKFSKKGNADVNDAIYTSLGGIVGLIVCLIKDWLL